MAFHEYLLIMSLFFILMSLIFILKSQGRTTVIPTNWPILGAIPAHLVNAHRLLDYATEVLMHSGGTIMLKGPWFANMDMVITTNPIDVHHVLTKNFSNYPKGDDFRKIFDILGDGIFNADGELWESHRKITMSLLKAPEFQSLLQTVLWKKVENGLIPVLESISRQGVDTDLQEIFQRFTFDTICELLFDHDPKSLSLDLPHMPCLKAFADVEEAILLRHVLPPCLWRLQQLLRVGKEKKLSDGWKTVDQFIYNCLSRKSNYEHQEEKFSLLRAFKRELKDQIAVFRFRDHTKFLRDTLINLMVAGKDSTSTSLSWFFYIIAKNPTIEEKILEEIHTHLKVKPCEKWNAKEVGEMVYLHGALNESLRLFPPLPFNHKSPLQPDKLPSGYEVMQNTKIILCYYSMGRMKSIWGEDCMECKPERWITKVGGMKCEPSYKFPVFNGGPRICLGKDMSLWQLKMVSAIIIYNYHIEVVEGHPVLPANSMVLQMKHGLKVRLTKRNGVN